MSVILALTFGLACVVLSVDADKRIVGGSNAQRHQFPHQISLQLQGRHWCGGAIITPNWVISASHCVYNFQNPNQWTVVAGLLNLLEQHPDVQTSRVAKIIVHPEYTNGNEIQYDVSLLQVVSPFKFTEAVKPIRLPRPGDKFSGNVVVSGWGSTQNKPEVINPTALQYLKMPIISDQECNDIFRKTNAFHKVITKTLMCTLPETYKSACHGDSGGPLVQNGVLVGVVQGGQPECGFGFDVKLPNVYIKVTTVLPFINQYVTGF